MNYFRCNDVRVSQRSAFRLLTLCFVLSVAVTAVGCKTVQGPDYKTPAAPQKKAWESGIDARAAQDAKAAIEPDWWRGFGNQYLDQLIGQAIEGDFNLRVLALRLEQAGIGVEAEENQLLPTVKATAGANFQKQTNESSTQSYAVNVGLNWEIDIWGKTKKGINAKKADYQATEAEWRAAYLTLVSSVATRYFEILQFDEQMRNQAQTLDYNRKLLRIYKAQYKEGLLPESRLLSQKAEINTLQRDQLELERQRRVAELSLATLLGVPAGSLEVPAGSLTENVDVPVVPPGLPSDLLVRRPDILAKEYRVLEAHELLGQARLARLPSVSLSSSVGGASTALSALLKAWTFGLAPSINIPIFDPSIQTNIKSKTVDMEVAEEEYRGTVVKAYEEVETALLNVAYRKQQKVELQQQINYLRVVRNVQYAQLEEGLVSQLEVFETDRSLLSAQQGLLATHQQILSDTVNLYKALGGGWPAERVTQKQ